jgi:asparagine synthetase A
MGSDALCKEKVQHDFELYENPFISMKAINNEESKNEDEYVHSPIVDKLDMELQSPHFAKKTSVKANVKR